MKVTVLGASGRAGSEIVKELARRGHAVTAVARRPERIPEAPGVTAVAGDVNQPATLVPALSGADAVVSAIMFVDSDPQRLIAPGQALINTPGFPDAYRAEAEAGGRFLETLRAEPELNWTFLSPSALFDGSERTATFRLGDDALLTDDQGNSRISFPDYAIAMVDEIETPCHPRARFTVGY